MFKHPLTLRLHFVVCAGLFFSTVATVPAAVVFSFNFNDATNVGFNDNTQGAARRNALTEAGNLVSSLFGNYNATIVLDVDGSNNEVGTLAAAASNVNSPNPTISSFGGRGDVMLKILNGNGADPNPGAADGTVTWNFVGQPWEYGSDYQAGEFDFISTAAHELLHAVGFSSSITQQGQDAYGTAPGTAGFWSPFDEFVAGAAGSIIDSTTFALDISRWNTSSVAGGAGQGLRFNGPNTLAANSGNPAFIFSPNPWQDGSSGSHLDDALYASTFMMEAATNPGAGIRTFSPLEIAMLRDIGYTQVVPEPSTMLLLLSALALGFRRRRRA